MDPIRTWFLQPYPFEQRLASTLHSAFWAGLFVTLFLFFIKPFGTQVASGGELKFLVVCGYFGLVTVGITLIVNGLCLLLPGIFKEEKWTVWKEILFNLFFIGCVGLGNLMLANLLWEVPLNARTFWIWQGFTFAVGIFPTIVGAFFTQMKLSKKYAAEAALLLPTTPSFASASVTTMADKKASAGKPATAPSFAEATAGIPATAVTFIGENQNETLTLDASQIAYIVAQDNYVQVYFFENEVLKNRMLRATLRKKEDILASWPQFFRCHRTYLVNFDKVEKVSGNAQGYRLHLRGVEETIPVSRNLNEQVRKRLRP
ncbi:MAG: LytTR family transcriptional regulator [Saprospiraceae bacterium]|nr:LytTR family transcriptional regulator [Saprospiraceae bacterium]